MNKTLMILSSLALAASCSQVIAGDAAAGAKKIATCVACHGKTGKATAPNYPNLHCQNEKYLVDALEQYKSGARANPLMKPMMATLKGDDIANVAAYYASQPCE